MTENKSVELSESFIVLAIPSSTVEVTISAKVWNGDKVVEVRKTMPFSEVREAIKEDRYEEFIEEFYKK